MTNQGRGAASHPCIILWNKQSLMVQHQAKRMPVQCRVDIALERPLSSLRSHTPQPSDRRHTGSMQGPQKKKEKKAFRMC